MLTRALISITCSVLLYGCGGSPTNTCNIAANVIPASAMADHNAASPGSQVQFTAAGNVAGNCPVTPDVHGIWMTSDPGNTSINQQGLATCLGATTTPATITNSGTIRGKSFTPAILTCR